LDPLLILLNSIASGLSDEELSKMKFLCKDKIEKRKRDEVQSGQKLFDILMERRLIAHDNLEFLKKLLQHVHRDDLVAQVVHFEEEDPHAPDDQPNGHEKPVNVICDYIGREWKKLLRELGMPEVKLDRIVAAYPRDLDEQLVQGLRQWQLRKGKDAKVADLIKALRACDLNYAADKVEE
ncbi:FADD protein, partial [Toxostoma redivivum]|nr:FADD protein [Toxostoma redivivum]